MWRKLLPGPGAVRPSNGGMRDLTSLEARWSRYRRFPSEVVWGDARGNTGGKDVLRAVGDLLTTLFVCSWPANVCWLVSTSALCAGVSGRVDTAVLRQVHRAWFLRIVTSWRSRSWSVGQVGVATTTDDGRVRELDLPHLFSVREGRR